MIQGILQKKFYLQYSPCEIVNKWKTIKYLILWKEGLMSTEIILTGNYKIKTS